jgi:hypothetical protein
MDTQLFKNYSRYDSQCINLVVDLINCHDILNINESENQTTKTIDENMLDTYFHNNTHHM